MKDLLPHYEQELILLRQRAAEFAARFPGPASHLGIVGENCGDPHVERLIQATALLTARVRKSLDDGYARFTEALLESLLPHYLRPFPSCAIVQARHPDSATDLAISRGAELQARPAEGVSCRFRTSYTIRQLPLRLPNARFATATTTPPSMRLPADCGASIAIDIEATDPQHGFATLGERALRVYLDGDASFVSVLRDVLHGRVAAACIETESGEWTRLNAVPLSPVGFADDEALVPFSPRSHPAHRLLTEYFAFPEKFNFVDIELAKFAPHVVENCGRITLHLFVNGVRADSHEARRLSNLSSDNLLLGCAPVVNLFRQSAVPIMLMHERADYALLADAERAGAYDIHAVEAVRMLERRALDTVVTDFRPFYSLRHGEGLDSQGRYYLVRRDDGQAAGHEFRIAFVNADLDPANCGQATVSVDLTCTNRDLPQRLVCGRREGDLLPPPDWSTGSVTFVRRPSAPRRLAATPALQWRLLSHLTLNFRSLVQEGLDGFREMLSLYDLAQTPDVKGQIEAIVGLAQRPAAAWIRDRRGATLVHGVEVRITLNEDGFVGSGLPLFARVLDRFLGLYVQVNSFTELVVLSAKTGKELMRCQPRNGEQCLA